MKTIKILTAFGAIALFGVLLVAFWRMSGMLNWRRSLRQELKDFNSAAEQAAGARRQAMMRVADACEGIRQTTTPDIERLADIRGFIRSIAECFHPQAEIPELCISVARTLTAFQDSAEHLERILKRPGFNRLQRIRIRHVHKTFEWYERLRQKWIVRRIHRSRHFIRRIYHGYLVVLPDPFSLLIFFSNRLSLLQLTRYLVLDVYLFAGRLAVDAYDAAANDAAVFSEAEVERTLEALDDIENSDYDPSDPQIRQIRNRLVGIGPFLLAAPGLSEWQAAVMESAEVIAGRYFPETERPLEEAALGPLLRRARDWLRKLGEIERIPGINQLYRIRLDTLYNMKSLGDVVRPEQLWRVAKRTWRVYRWMRLPLKAYRFFKRSTPLRMATAAGFILVRKGVLNFILRYAFDNACRELDLLYRQSRQTGPDLLPPDRE